MKNIGGTSRFIGFFDECGDHSLAKIDPDFPLFLLALVVMERKAYVDTVIPALGRFKLRYWNHEGINLHSRDIRLARGPFSLLQHPQRRPVFMAEVSEFMAAMPFTLFVTAIRKQQHSTRYGPRAANPYGLALEFAMERLVNFLEAEGETELPIIAEARGKREDAELESVFNGVIVNGTAYRTTEQFRRLKLSVVFRSKQDNVAGTQLADLCAYPCARHILSPDRPNPAYDIVRSHLYKRGSVSGWKVFP